MTIRILPADRLRRVLNELAALPAHGRPAPGTLRAELSPLLAIVLLGPGALEQYTEALSDLGPGVAVPRISIDTLPVEAVLRDGLTALTDEQFAAVALNPQVVSELHGRVSAARLDGTAGPAWDDVDVVPDLTFPPGYLSESRVAETVEMFRSIEDERRRPHANSL